METLVFPNFYGFNSRIQITTLLVLKERGGNDLNKKVSYSSKALEFKQICVLLTFLKYAICNIYSGSIIFIEVKPRS